MRVELNLIDNWSKIYSNWEVLSDYNENYDYRLLLYVDGSEKIEDLLKDKTGLIEIIDAQIDFLRTEKLDDIDTEARIMYYQNLKDNIDKIDNGIECITLDFDELDYCDFIKNDPFFTDKPIIIDKQVDVTDHDFVEYLNKNAGKYKDSIYIRMKNNTELIGIDNCLDTIEYIKASIEAVEKYDMSPMEKIMYIYDRLKGRIYEDVEDEEKLSESRDLSSVINGNKIVCAGYASIFDALLTYCGLNSTTIHLEVAEDPTIGHVRNLVYIKDEKYDIDGAYYFDVTFDSKKKNETNKYLNRYRFFAKTRNQIAELDNRKLIDLEFQYYSQTMLEEVEMLFLQDVKDAIKNPIFKSVNYMSSIIRNDILLRIEHFVPQLYQSFNLDREKVLEKAKETINMFNKPISAETYIKLLNNVRKIEYNEAPALYPYTTNDIFASYVNSGWEFEEEHLDPEQRLRLALFGENPYENEEERVARTFLQFINEEKIGQEIKQIKQMVKKK